MGNLVRDYQKVTSQDSQNYFTYDEIKFSIYSTSLLRFKNNLRNLTKCETDILKLMIEEIPCIKGGGHDISKTDKTWSNRWLSKMLGHKVELIRRAKEGLQARGIILIDGRYYDEHLVNKNGILVRLRTFHRQTIMLTQEFINFMVTRLTDRNIDVDEPFNYHPHYVDKVEKRKNDERQNKRAWEERQFQKRLVEMGIDLSNVVSGIVDKFVDKPVDNPSESLDKVRMECVPKNDQNIRMECVPYLIQDDPNSIKSGYLNSRDYDYEGMDKSDSKSFGNISRAIGEITANAEKVIKEWKEETTKTCDILIKSGKTYYEVGMLMVKQRYVRSFNHFQRLYSPPIE